MTEGTDRGVPAELLRIRGSIDNIDAALIHLLAERFKCTQSVGRLKAEEGLPPSDPAREERQIARLRVLAGLWLAEHDVHAAGVRVDVVAIWLPRGGPARIDHRQGVA